MPSSAANAKERDRVTAKGIGAGLAQPYPGMITFIQRTGSALNVNVHLHILLPLSCRAISGKL